MIRYSMLVLLLAAFLSSCKKDKEDNPWGLPPATQTGANTFGCLIDGKPWVAEIGLGIFDPSLRKLDMSYDETGTGKYYNNGWGMIANFYKDSSEEFISLSAQYFDKAVVLNWRQHLLSGSLLLDAPTVSGFTRYHLDTLLPYRVEITKLDTLKNICAGRFEFFAVHPIKKDTLHITEGRFDKKYSPE